MTDITELAQLRAELSNPAIGSKDHLRKLALSLVEALEKAQQRITQLESRTVKLPEPEQWDITQVLLCKKKVFAAMRAAGIKWEAE
ncbi:hypothetical protein ORL60_02240 [Klebsiella michiganensis]|uniref:hypothetical protein n=1 Tax=Klebsiella michiganensis TaxID=1134687 RepID=UPI00224788EC|nr:hypothetical protein [Klebsiella michiganensis]MCW9668094.1 hypothetical protein [Klebsiella michiganensis]